VATKEEAREGSVGELKRLIDDEIIKGIIQV